jgi:hypothetical protein
VKKETISSQKPALAIVITIVLVLVGVGIHHFKFSGREPAAINRSNLFDESRPLDTSMLAKEVLSGADIKLAGKEAALTLNLKSGLCEAFDQIEITFEAEGIATNGARPSLHVSGPCESADLKGSQQRFFIPYDILRSQRAVPGAELSFSPHSEFLYRVENFEGAWPEHWVLTEIRGYRKNATGAEFKIGRKEIYTFSSRPLQMIW